MVVLIDYAIAKCLDFVRRNLPITKWPYFTLDADHKESERDR